VVNIYLLGLVSLLNDLSTEMVYPLLPLYLTSIGAGPAIIGLIEGLATSVAYFLRVVSGYLADRFGRRKPLVIAGYACGSVSKLLLYAAASWPGVLAARLVDRFGKGVRTAPRDALIAEAVPRGRRGSGFGLHRFLDTLGGVAGVLVAIALLGGSTVVVRSIFLWAAVPAALSLIVLVWVRETGRARAARNGALDDQAPVGPRPRPVSPLQALTGWGRLDPRTRAFLIVVFLFGLGNPTVQFLLLRASWAGFAPATVLLLYLAYNLAYLLVTYPAGRLSDRIGRRALLVAGYSFYTLASLLLAFARGWAFWPLFCGFGLYIGLTEGVEKALIADAAPPEQRATVIGLHATLTGIGALPASLLAGFLWAAFGPQAPFLAAAALGGCASLALVFVLPRGR